MLVDVVGEPGDEPGELAALGGRPVGQERGDRSQASEPVRAARCVASTVARYPALGDLMSRRLESEPRRAPASHRG